MQKAMANERLPGAQSPAILVIANDYAMALAPGKFALGTDPGSTLGKLCQHACKLLQDVSASLESF